MAALIGCGSSLGRRVRLRRRADGRPVFGLGVFGVVQGMESGQESLGRLTRWIFAGTQQFSSEDRVHGGKFGEHRVACDAFSLHGKNTI